jgi:hypothetical protein
VSAGLKLLLEFNPNATQMIRADPTGDAIDKTAFAIILQKYIAELYHGNYEWQIKKRHDKQ